MSNNCIIILPFRCHLLWEIPVPVNEVECDNDQDEEAQDTDTDGGHCDQARAGAQSLSQLVSRVAQAAVREGRGPKPVQGPDTEIQTAVGV